MMDLSNGGSNAPAPFLVKTYEMVDDPLTNPVVSWSHTGHSFVVWNPPALLVVFILTAFEILVLWEDCMPEGLVCCDVTTCKTKVIPREYGFIAQLNEGMHLKKRPIEFQVDQVLQRFDENKLSFTKVGQENSSLLE